MVAVLIGVLVVVLGNGSGSPATISGPPGPEGVPLEVGRLLAPASTAATGQPVDGIQCDSSEQLVYHVHTHLSVYVNGVLRPLPAGVGIVSPVAEQTVDGPIYGATRCYYWLHVHAQDGVIHIESPTTRTYTLGQFFDVWGQPLTTDQVASASGPMKVYVNGRRRTGDPRRIPLGSHEDIQIDVGAPATEPKALNWSVTRL